jgi:uncharacterized membrane protein (DUF4010 family)
VEARISPELDTALGLWVAGLVGLAVGIEREWSGHASGPGARFAGARTFLLLGLIGGVAGILAWRELEVLAASLVLGGAALAVTAFALAARRGGPEAIDGTTEAAALAVLAVGLIAGLGEIRLAAAVGAVMVLVLREKSAIHGFVRRLGDVELRAALQFAVLALVLLPILPEGPYGPLGGIRPRELWIVVLLVSGLNFAAYLARRAIGETHGTIVAGMLGGLISSTAVSLSFARQSRGRSAGATSLALGVVGASTVLLPRLAVLTAILRPNLTSALVLYFLPPLAVGVVLLGLGLWRSREVSATSATEGRSPLHLGSAMLLALGFQLALMAMVFVRERFGSSGVVVSSALLGLTDMDALTLSMSRLATEPVMLPLAAKAMAVGVLSNTLLKLFVVVTVGSGPFRWRAGAGLLALGAGSALGLYLGLAR